MHFDETFLVLGSDYGLSASSVTPPVFVHFSYEIVKITGGVDEREEVP